ncbi:MAG: HepT-like ribonuclease domain-containing protein [Candidatus Nanopelagicales bacterium]
MRRELLLLREMRDAAVAIRDLVGNRTAEEVDADAVRRSALLWHFTVLGEAASQIPVETKDAHPEIAWRAATRLRNRIVHGYWDIDVETLVATAVDDLPRMIGQLEDAFSTLHTAEDDGPPAWRRRHVHLG